MRASVCVGGGGRGGGEGGGGGDFYSLVADPLSGDAQAVHARANHALAL